MSELRTRLHPTSGGHACEAIEPLIQPRLLFRKRLLDLMLLSLLAVPALTLVSFFSLLTRLLHGGPALYRQVRVGYRGRIIQVWKMRTMEHDAESILADHLQRDPAAREEWSRNYKLRNDPRILPYVGSFLRRTSLDELPQLLNILWGEMSFVGPRPLPEYHFHSLDQDFRNLRQSVPPGLTGLWQVNERSDGDLTSHQRWDLDYIRNFSLWMDLRILLRTPLVVLTGRGAC
ncbi:MAG: sugar transferase [Vulcanimicrobiota bacterium]